MSGEAVVDQSAVDLPIPSWQQWHWKTRFLVVFRYWFLYPGRFRATTLHLALKSPAQIQIRKTGVKIQDDQITFYRSAITSKGSLPDFECLVFHLYDPSWINLPSRSDNSGRTARSDWLGTVRISALCLVSPPLRMVSQPEAPWIWCSLYSLWNDWCTRQSAGEVVFPPCLILKSSNHEGFRQQCWRLSCIFLCLPERRIHGMMFGGASTVYGKGGHCHLRRPSCHQAEWCSARLATYRTPLNGSQAWFFLLLRGSNLRRVIRIRIIGDCQA